MKETLLEVLPPFKHHWRLISGSQSVGDIITEVLRAHKQYSKGYDAIAPYFENGETLRKLFKFCKRELPYEIESDEKQTTRSPAGILALAETMGVDCKHYAQFIGGVLSALNRFGYDYNWCYRFACYDGSKLPDHVFVVVKDPGGEIWIDPTPIQNNGSLIGRTFDDRQLLPTYYVDKKLKDMSLYSVSGSRLPQTVGATTPGLTSTAFDLAKADPNVKAAVTAIDTISAMLPDGALKDFLKDLTKDPVATIWTLVKGKTYTSNDYRLGEYYMRSILGMPEIQRRGQVPDAIVPQAWNFWTAALGTRIKSADDLDALGTSVQTYLTRPGGTGIDANPAQAERAYQILKLYDYPTSESDSRRNLAWPLKSFAQIPYIGQLPGYLPGTFFNGIHPITGKKYSNGFEVGSSGLTIGADGLPIGADQSAFQSGTTFPWKTVFLVGGVGVGAYLLLKSGKGKRK